MGDFETALEDNEEFFWIYDQKDNIYLLHVLVVSLIQSFFNIYITYIY